MNLAEHQLECTLSNSTNISAAAEERSYTVLLFGEHKARQ
jgi:hypothetical protein